VSDKRKLLCPFVSSDPDVHGGTPCIDGTGGRYVSDAHGTAASVVETLRKLADEIEERGDE
jgi:hypothetical protein